MTAPDYGMAKDVVPPGSQTGIYYIPISNLPFNVSWQQMKDYVRQVCEVDHVEIFQRSTSGWVRVRGQENFEAAFSHLNGKEFNGRAIIAEGKNADSPILVRDLMVCKPTGAACRSSDRTSTALRSVLATTSTIESPAVYATGGPVRLPDFPLLASPVSTISSSLSQVGAASPTALPRQYEQFPSHAFTQSPPCLPNYGFTASYNCSQVGIPPSPSFYSLSATPDCSQLYEPVSSYAVQSPYSDYYGPVTTSLNEQFAGMAMTGNTSGVIYTEQRGIQIRDISRRATADQIRKMLREATAPEANLISDIHIPFDKEGKPRGLAFVRFRTADIAKQMEMRLHGADFKGKKLQVRLMKDGEAISGYGRPTSSVTSSRIATTHSNNKHQQHQSRKGDDGRRSERKDREKSGKAGGYLSSKATSTPPSSSHKTPLVVAGSCAANSTVSTTSHASSASSATKSPRTKGKEKHDKRPSVVIVDGSSCSGSRRPSRTEM
ncbi:hypothetical protein BD289DRAFT_478236 [Coniella lustricola]|uniref:RRM domain-containing protein n=1 Tax=Coniella lustricola TaxID=2025994 RepID=A0A2T3AMS1_9PEZI|nr:hypothetical protein BD289DRAFT_478236 [Coniella lustricola]